MSSTDDLVRNNASYAEAFDKQGLPAAPGTRVAVVSCMDARIDVHKILGLEEGDAHVIRNAGGLVTDDVIRSLVLSQRVLGTEEVIVMQHTGCGMLDLPEDDIAGELERETGKRPDFSFGAFSDLHASVREGVEALVANAFLKDSVRGFVYDVDTGRLSEVTQGDD